mmetsp:Transcript_13237/g.43868  ORF Transcript_13237/g.43868 Transcript_13237/m.43868 type:complete len:409 (+) Transcript_13237:655-1881(+)
MVSVAAFNAALASTSAKKNSASSPNLLSPVFRPFISETIDKPRSPKTSTPSFHRKAGSCNARSRIAGNAVNTVVKKAPPTPVDNATYRSSTDALKPSASAMPLMSSGRFTFDFSHRPMTSSTERICSSGVSSPSSSPLFSSSPSPSPPPPPPPPLLLLLLLELELEPSPSVPVPPLDDALASTTSSLDSRKTVMRASIVSESFTKNPFFASSTRSARAKSHHPWLFLRCENRCQLSRFAPVTGAPRVVVPEAACCGASSPSPPPPSLSNDSSSSAHAAASPSGGCRTDSSYETKHSHPGFSGVVVATPAPEVSVVVLARSKPSSLSLGAPGALTCKYALMYPGSAMLSPFGYTSRRTSCPHTDWNSLHTCLVVFLVNFGRVQTQTEECVFEAPPGPPRSCAAPAVLAI